jgi:hypothetical protein
MLEIEVRHRMHRASERKAADLKGREARRDQSSGP